MIKIYKDIWSLFNTQERKRSIQLLILMVLTAFVELVGIGAIMPFLSVLGKPSVVETNKYLFSVYDYFKFVDTKQFLVFLGLVAFGFLLTSALIRSLAYYALVRFINMRRHTISERLLKKYLHQPYEYFFTKNSSDISKAIFSETDLVVNQIIRPALFLISYSIVAVAIIMLLLIANPLMAFFLIIIFGGLYSLIYLLSRKYISYIGLQRAKVNSHRFKIISEIIGGIKELKILGKEKVYIEAFKVPSLEYSKYGSISNTVARLPSFLVEVVFFGAILSMGMYAFVYEGSDLGSLLPILGLYTLSALKLKPAANNIYESLTAMKFGAAALETILNDLDEEDAEHIDIDSSLGRLPLNDKLELKNIVYYYKNSTRPVLNNVSIEIKARTIVGIIGTTGSGKSTLVDIILGLLMPSSGEIHIDNRLLLPSDVREWQNSIGYGPQSIFLADDTIAENIAFGVEKDQVDIQRVQKAAKIAQAHTFISSFSDGYSTVTGERGIKLSGGQKQRLGIARALYSDPEILILDEATSALDNQTEADVMRAINAMGGSKTIIMIAHRLSTIEGCDMVIKLKGGKIIYV